LTIDILEGLCKKNFQSMGRYYDIVYNLVS